MVDEVVVVMVLECLGFGALVNFVCLVKYYIHMFSKICYDIFAYYRDVPLSIMNVLHILSTPKYYLSKYHVVMELSYVLCH